MVEQGQVCVLVHFCIELFVYPFVHNVKPNTNSTEHWSHCVLLSQVQRMCKDAYKKEPTFYIHYKS